jgi:ATP-dependent Clp protease protease subunit
MYSGAGDPGEESSITDALYSKLLGEGVIMLSGVIDEYMANVIVPQLLLLDSNDLSQYIYMYINSPGGDITSGLAIYDTMQYIRAPISTICIGHAYSMGAFLLSSGDKGKRFSLPNSRIMIHQPLGECRGQATDIEIHAKEILQIKNKMNSLLANNTGQTIAKISRDIERDNFMSAIEAKEYGLIDQIIVKR